MSSTQMSQRLRYFANGFLPEHFTQVLSGKALRLMAISICHGDEYAAPLIGGLSTPKELPHR